MSLVRSLRSNYGRVLEHDIPAQISNTIDGICLFLNADTKSGTYPSGYCNKFDASRYCRTKSIAARKPILSARMCLFSLLVAFTSFTSQV